MSNAVIARFFGGGASNLSSFKRSFLSRFGVFRHCGLDPQSHNRDGVGLTPHPSYGHPLLSWIFSTLTECHFLGFAQVRSICSLSGLRPSENPPQGAREQETCHPEFISGSHNNDDNAIVGHLSSQARTARNDEEKPFNPSTVKLLNHSSLKKSAFTFAEVFSPHFAGSHKYAFTLAEVLITLGIIGVVAAMTLPTLVQRQQEKVIVSKLKKSYSVMSQAYLMAVKDKGTPDQWVLVDNLNTENDEVDDANNFLYHMKDYLKITKYCGGKADGCWTNTGALKGGGFNNHEDQNRYSKALLADGSTILTYVLSPECRANYGAIKDVCGLYRIDVNGSTRPNVMGRDVFTFYFTKTRIVPAGTQLETGVNSFDNECRDAKTQYGRSCAAWVIYNENMDYLRCNDLSWEGKKKCN